MAELNRRKFVVLAGAVAGTALAMPSFGPTVLAHQADLDAAGYPSLDVTVTADGFEGIPETLEAGRYLLNATAEGVEEGVIAFLQPRDMTAEEFLTTLGGGSDDEPVPAFVYQATFAGGALALPDMPGSAVIDLTEGEWIAWGDQPEASQMPVVVTVTGEFPADVPEPEADLIATLIDFGIMVEGNLVAGEHVLRVENQGAQPHFIALNMVPDGTTNEDFAALLESEISGTPAAVSLSDADFVPVAYTATQSIGTVSWHAMSLEAGTYVAACWFPTAGIGDPHAYHGMHTVFVVS